MIAWRIASGFVVTPCVGVWIEMDLTYWTKNLKMSLPVWECGLKWDGLGDCLGQCCHSLCGSVD